MPRLRLGLNFPNSLRIDWILCKRESKFGVELDK
jgi:hypothetical protein